jgi:hypothetical protein
MSQVLSAHELPLPILGFQQLPSRITRFELIADGATGEAIVRVSFYLTDETLADWQQRLEPVLAEYELVKKAPQSPPESMDSERG